MQLQAPTITPYQGGQAQQYLQQSQANRQQQTAQGIGDLTKIGGFLASLIPVVGPLIGPLIGLGGGMAAHAAAPGRTATDQHIQQSQQPVQGTPMGTLNQPAQPQQNDSLCPLEEVINMGAANTLTAGSTAIQNGQNPVNPQTPSMTPTYTNPVNPSDYQAINLTNSSAFQDFQNAQNAVQNQYNQAAMQSANQQAIQNTREIGGQYGALGAGNSGAAYAAMAE